MYAVGAPADCLAFYEAFLPQAAQNGSVVDPLKSSFAYFNDKPLPQSVVDSLGKLKLPVAADTLNVMGTDVHKDGTVDAKFVPASVAEHIALLKQLSLPAFRVQHALLLARVSAAPALVYTARTQLPAKLGPAASALETATEQFLQAKLAPSAEALVLSPEQHEQAKLSLAKGGLGFRPLARIADAAYFASTAAAAPFLRKHGFDCAGVDAEAKAARARLLAKTDVKDSALLLPDTPSHIARFGEADATGVPLVSAAQLQRKINQALKKRELSLFASDDPQTVARLRALGNDLASRFLTVVPTLPELALKDSEMQIAVCYRLGVRQAIRTKGLSCPCGRLLVEDPFHGVSCSKCPRSKVIARHDSVKNAIVKWIKRSGNAASAEPREFSRGAERRLRPDFQSSLGASTIVGDIVVMDPAAPSNSGKSAPMATAAKNKVKKYKHFVGKAPGQADQFVPVAFETFGGFSAESVALIGLIGKETRGEGIESKDVVDGLTNEIAVAIQRGNAACILVCLQEGLAVVDTASAAAASDKESVASEEY